MAIYTLKKEQRNFAFEASNPPALEIRVQKNKPLKILRLVLDGKRLCPGMANTLEKAHQTAPDEAYHLLVDAWKRDPFEADAYASACVEIRLGGSAMAIVMAVVPDPQQLIL